MVEPRNLSAIGWALTLNVIEGRQSRDKEIEVGAIGVLDTEIVDYENKCYRAGKVAEEARGGRLDKVRLKQKGDEAALT